MPCCRTWAARRLNLSSELAQDRRAGEVRRARSSASQVDAIERGEDRIAFKETMNRLGIDMPESETGLQRRGGGEDRRGAGLSGRHPSGLHAGRHRRRPGLQRRGTAHRGQPRPLRQPGRPDPGRGIGAGLGGAGAGSGPRRQEPDDHRLLHRERRRHGRPHRRFLLHRAHADHRPEAAEASCRSTPTTSSRPSRSSAAPTSSSPTIRRPAGWWSSRSIPRTSRSSALASKATGFPIALVSAMLAGGLTLDEIPYWRDGTLEKYTPSGDYVVVKFSRWAFEKFQGAEDKLGTQMRAVGEVMSIGKTYKEAFQKSIRSLENGRYGLGFAKDFNKQSLDELMDLLAEPDQRAAVHHVRGPAQGRRRRGALREDLHQALVHRADEGTGGAGGEDPQVQGQGRCRTSC